MTEVMPVVANKSPFLGHLSPSTALRFWISMRAALERGTIAVFAFIARSAGGDPTAFPYPTHLRAALLLLLALHLRE